MIPDPGDFAGLIKTLVGFAAFIISLYLLYGSVSRYCNRRPQSKLARWVPRSGMGLPLSAVFIIVLVMDPTWVTLLIISGVIACGHVVVGQLK